MTAPAKLTRLSLDLDEKRAALRGLAGLYEESRVYQRAQRDAALRRVDRRFLAELWDDRRDDLSELAALDDDAFKRAGVDRVALEGAIAETARMTELRRRHDALAAEIAPLSRLVDRLRKYAEGTQ